MTPLRFFNPDKFGWCVAVAWRGDPPLFSRHGMLRAHGGCAATALLLLAYGTHLQRYADVSLSVRLRRIPAL